MSTGQDQKSEVPIRGVIVTTKIPEVALKPPSKGLFIQEPPSEMVIANICLWNWHLISWYNCFLYLGNIYLFCTTNSLRNAQSFKKKGVKICYLDRELCYEICERPLGQKMNFCLTLAKVRFKLFWGKNISKKQNIFYSEADNIGEVRDRERGRKVHAAMCECDWLKVDQTTATTFVAKHILSTKRLIIIMLQNL